MWRWAPSVRVGPQADRDIGWAEAVAVELGLRMAIHHGLIAGRPASQSRILVRSGNTGVVAVICARSDMVITAGNLEKGERYVNWPIGSPNFC